MDRINQLIKQATHDCMGVPILDKHEFAQLIIKECGTALNLPLRDMISRGQAYELIRQHFGITTTKKDRQS